MKKNLSKTFQRVKKKYPEVDNNLETKKLSPLEITVFRALQKKYDLSISSYEKKKEDSSNNDLKPENLNDSLRKTLNRIKAGKPFEF